MKTILCYGDSNTWGYNPVTKKRHDYNLRWTTILQKELGNDFLVIPEGQNGRTTVWEDPIELHKNGASYLPPCMESHKPIDLIIIMLGTNDLKQRFSLPAADIANGAGVLVDIVKKSNFGPNDTPPEILLIIPPKVQKLTDYAETFAGSKEKSQKFPVEYKTVAKNKKVQYLEIGKYVHCSDADGIHFESDQLSTLGKLITKKVSSFF